MSLLMVSMARPLASMEHHPPFHACFTGRRPPRRTKASPTPASFETTPRGSSAQIYEARWVGGCSGMAHEEGVGRRRRCTVCCERKFRAAGRSRRGHGEGGRVGEEERARRRWLGPRCGRRRRRSPWGRRRCIRVLRARGPTCRRHF
jgi:hypothetical protein